MKQCGFISTSYKSEISSASMGRVGNFIFTKKGFKMDCRNFFAMCCFDLFPAGGGGGLEILHD